MCIVSSTGRMSCNRNSAVRGARPQSSFALKMGIAVPQADELFTRIAGRCRPGFVGASEILQALASDAFVGCPQAAWGKSVRGGSSHARWACRERLRLLREGCSATDGSTKHQSMLTRAIQHSGERGKLAATAGERTTEGWHAAGVRIDGGWVLG